MSKVVARFEKVSFEQFEKDALGTGIIETIKEDLRVIYDNIKLPKRATKFSAGHDFWIPFSIKLTPGEEIIIPSGIRCVFNEDNNDILYSLDLYPRSGHGFKYKLRIKNTIGRVA